MTSARCSQGYAVNSTEKDIQELIKAGYQSFFSPGKPGIICGVR